MRHHAIHLLAVLLLAGCSGSDHSPTKPASWTPGTCADFAVVTTNYQTGRIREVGVDSGTIAMRADSQAVNSDAVARVYGGLIYVVNRFGADNVQVVDPAHGFTTIRQFSVGIGSNPHDIVVTAADRAYVSRYGRASVLGLDPRSGAVRDSISLASLADADGIPDMDRMFYAAPYLYVALERISFTPPNYPPVPPSYLAIIDTRADTLAGAITLQ